jgi:glycine/D-amino acid oxidase-like deaminating enzyme
MRSADVIIIGGGVMGWSTAFWISRSSDRRVIVVEADPGHARSATALSAASIRQQFSQAINVEISRFGIQFIRDFELSTGGPNLRFMENGYLILARSPAEATALEASALMQRDHGAGTEILVPADLGRQFPWLNVDDLFAASFGSRDEGWFDNIGLLQGLRAAARRAGAVEHVGRAEGLEPRDNWDVRLTDGTVLSASEVVVAAGTGARPLLRSIDEEIPVENRKRVVYVIDAPGMRHREAPLIVDPAGLWMRPEGSHWICARTPREDPAVDPEDFTIPDQDFEEDLWPLLAHRCPGFERLRVLRHWVGHYDMNVIDANAIVGRWPGREELYVLNGFSGHGLQQAPAVGRGIAELIVEGRYVSLDLSELGPERLFNSIVKPETTII